MVAGELWIPGQKLISIPERRSFALTEEFLEQFFLEVAERMVQDDRGFRHVSTGYRSYFDGEKIVLKPLLIEHVYKPT